MSTIAKVAMHLRHKPVIMLLLVMLFGVLFRISILYPSYANGFPPAYDGYVHAGSAYLIAKGGLEASPTSRVYPPIFLLFLAFLYEVSGIHPIFLIIPVGIAIEVLYVPLMFYITFRISGNRIIMGYLAAFFQSINPLTIVTLISGSIPALLAILGFLFIICILVSDLRNKPVAIVPLGLLGALILLTNILVGAFYVCFIALIFVYEILLRRKHCYFKPLFLSLIISSSLAAIFYVPRIGYLNFGSTLGGWENLIWNSYNLVLLSVVTPPILFLLRSGSRKRYIPAQHQHLNLLKLWYLLPLLITLIFFWQPAFSSRTWHFVTLPAIAVISMVLVTKLNIMKRARRPRTVTATAAAVLLLCLALTYTGCAITFEGSFNATPERLQLMNWIETNTSPNARFCTEEEYFPTNLGWYILGLTGRRAYESILNFTGPYEVTTDAALTVELSNKIVTLPAGSPDWIQAVKELNITYVVLLPSRPHPNYASIPDKVVFTNVAYIVYNVTQFTLA